MVDLSDFISFLLSYFQLKVVRLLGGFFILKDFFLGVILQKRGKYVGSFLNSSLIFLILVIAVSAPTIAQNHPLQTTNVFSQDTVNIEEAQVSLDEASVSVNTIRTENTVRSGVEVYTAQAGDNLRLIAKKFKLSENSILWANDFSQGIFITKGTKVKIPPVDGVVHTVQVGDTIHSIAKKYKADSQSIADFPYNEFTDSVFSLVAGSAIVVPNGSKEVIADGAADTYIFAKVVAGVKGSSSFIWPTNGAVTQYPSSYHMALDIANASNPPVFASDGGTIVYSGCFSWGYGCHIIIDHNNGYRTLYGHLLRRDVEQGAVVSQNQQIGIMGSTGRSTGTHLHFEIRSGNTLLNPQNFLR